MYVFIGELNYLRALSLRIKLLKLEALKHSDSIVINLNELILEYNL